MTKSIVLFLLLGALTLSGCNSNNTPSTGNNTGGNTGSQTGGGTGGTGTQDNTPKKIKVNKHILSDSNPPFDIYSPGQQVTEATWNSFKNGGASKFNNHYNFTYTAFYSANNYQQQFFTKNGYALKSLQGSTYSSMYYERKSGSTFYQYISVSDGWKRQETNSFNLTNTFTNRIIEEIKAHMFAFSNYKWNEYQENYTYDGGTFTSTVQFQSGYLSSLIYTVDSVMFRIDKMFCTEITIPESYYYQ